METQKNIFSSESLEGVKKMDVVVDNKKYKPEYKFQLQEVKEVTPCVCCGEAGEQWQECVIEILDHGTEDEKIMKEIEQKLKNMIKEIENAMSVCAECYDDEFKLQRTKLYVDVASKVTKKYNGKATDYSFLLNNKKNE